MRKKYTQEKRERMTQMGARLQEVRKASGLSLGEIADRLNREFGANTNKGMISKYENGIHEPSAGTVYCLSKILGVSGDYILGKSDSSGVPKLVQGIEAPAHCLKVCRSVKGDDEWEWDENQIHFISTEWLVGGSEYFGYIVKGNRLAPRYYSGDLLVFERKIKAGREQTALVKVGDGEAFLARINKKRGGKWIEPLDPVMQSHFYTTTEIASLPVRILGVALELRRSEKV